MNTSFDTKSIHVDPNKHGMWVRYLIAVQSHESIEQKVRNLCLEQTVEVVEELVTSEFIEREIVADILSVQPIQQDANHRIDKDLLLEGLKHTTSFDNDFLYYDVYIGFSASILANQIPQVLSVLYGNISLQIGIKVIEVHFSDTFLAEFSGPRFGVQGIREVLFGTSYKSEHESLFSRPLFATALKPMGKSAEELGALAFTLAYQDVDIIKDDHGLVDHDFCPFDKRVQACVSSIQRAQDRTKKRVLYFPSITDRCDRIMERAYFAKEAGADGLLLSPFIVGLDTMRMIAEDAALNLPIMAHPALTGSFFQVPAGGIHESVLLGSLMRLCGADLVVFPNFMGRFPFSKSACLSIARVLEQPMGRFRSVFPVPAGGIKMERLPELRATYSKDTVFLVGSDLLRRNR